MRLRQEDEAHWRMIYTASRHLREAPPKGQRPPLATLPAPLRQNRRGMPYRAMALPRQHERRRASAAPSLDAAHDGRLKAEQKLGRCRDSSFSPFDR